MTGKTGPFVEVVIKMSITVLSANLALFLVQN